MSVRNTRAELHTNLPIHHTTILQLLLKDAHSSHEPRSLNRLKCHTVSIPTCSLHRRPNKYLHAVGQHLTNFQISFSTQLTALNSHYRSQHVNIQTSSYPYMIVSELPTSSLSTRHNCQFLCEHPPSSFNTTDSPSIATLLPANTLHRGHYY